MSHIEAVDLHLEEEESSSYPELVSVSEMAFPLPQMEWRFRESWPTKDSWEHKHFSQRGFMFLDGGIGEF